MMMSSDLLSEDTALNLNMTNRLKRDGTYNAVWHNDILYLDRLGQTGQ
jgi:hypothetical protein